MARVELRRQLVEQLVDQVGLALEGVAQWVERGRAGGQPLRVAGQLELGGDALADHVGEIVDVQAREVLRAVGDPEPTERPRERVVVGGAGATVDRREPRTLGEQVAPDDPQREPRIAALEEPHDVLDRRDVAVAVREEAGDHRRRLLLLELAGPRAQLVEDPLDAAAREHREEQLDRGRIGLGTSRSEPLRVLLAETRQGTPSPGTAC
jgi:hypothetical protein